MIVLQIINSGPPFQGELMNLLSKLQTQIRIAFSLLFPAAATFELDAPERAHVSQLNKQQWNLFLGSYACAAC